MTVIPSFVLDSMWMSLYSAKNNCVSDDKADYFSVTGGISAMKRDNCMYQVNGSYD